MIWQVDPHFYDYLSLNHDSLQLYFCYRWLLLWFKREFVYSQVMAVWEVILSCKRGERQRFVLCIALAMLDLAKQQLMTSCTRFDEILAYLNEQSGKWDVEMVLERASAFEAYFEARE